MRLRTLWLTDFRSYPTATLDCPEGLCVLTGRNGVGKSNVLEAIAYLATLKSFRGVPSDAMVATGASSAVVRAEVVDAAGRDALVEAEIAPTGRSRVQVNRQRLRRSTDLLGTLRVTVFSPDDLEIVKGGPSLRRDLLDDLLVAVHPRHELVRTDWEKALRQRNALLKSVKGRLDADAAFTLDVWDAKASAAGEALTALREELVARLGPRVEAAYRELAGGDDTVSLHLRRSWDGDLAAALDRSRSDDVRRAVTLVGPHRDDVVITLNGRPARTHASQGEQRCTALALRVAAHREVWEEIDTPPVLLLDDVFSELDPARSAALLASLPASQTFLTTASPLPEGVHPDLVVDVTRGVLAPRGAARATDPLAGVPDAAAGGSDG